MSLFGDDQPSPGPRASSTSLFDDSAGQESSPWSMPTPKKAGKKDVIKTLLPASDVPTSYIESFDSLLESDYQQGPGKINLKSIHKLFEGSGLEQGGKDKILGIIGVAGQTTPREGLGRNEFNVLLALIGLAQEKEEASLDGVDERRSSKNIRHTSALYIG